MNDDTSITAQEDSTAFAIAWAQFENMIGKNYLDVLNEAVPIQSDFEFDKAFDQIKMNHIVRIVYDKNENTLAKLSSLYSALNMSGASVYILLHNTGGSTEFYIGVRADDEYSAASAMEVLQNSFVGNFPGVDQRIVEAESKNETSLAGISDAIRSHRAFATVTGVPSLKDNTKDNFSQGLEKLIDSIGAKPFSALFLATPINRHQLGELEFHYQNLYSDLSLLNISQLSLSEQESISFGKSISDGISKSLSESMSLATTQTTGTSTSTTDGKTTSLAASVAGAGAAAGAALGTYIAPGVGTVAGAAIGGGVGTIVGSFLGSKNHSLTTGTTKSKSESTTETHGTTTTTTTNTTTTQTLTDTQGRTLQYEVKNRRISDALKIIDEQLERIRVAKSYGAWNWAAYFSAPDIDTVKVGAEAYAGILRGEKTGVEHCAVSYWTDDMDGFESAIKDISCFRHLRFDIGQSSNPIVISPTAMLSTQEMAVGMALPQKSTPGLAIFESVEFGRAVTTYDDISRGRQIKLGQVSHFGSEENNTVELNVNSLTAHTFITGSTGAGKSNAVYSILSELQGKYKIPFLVVEPAKGEYKYVFPNAHVFGTNPYLTELLKINPFSFPKPIHITEHIDRLIEILNAVWPMYAAMPAILKEAVELTYRKCGWDLLTSRNKYSESTGETVFPDFVDLLENLPTVIEASQYSEEVKSNYAGSLLTRVKSLTNGYYRNIFQKDELSPEILFDQTCIVDLSRVGSSETKSMLMGVIFLKLQEYRMSNAEQQNVELRHITVLEEAHNLLRRTNITQGQESANLQGKAVEMITNAIAEMRTYGEGFIIADQAPGLLDESVIRNTNTKIILRLPDFDDRLLVGKAENLSDAQIDELARLKTGCASIYQNNWQGAVLCQITEFKQDTKEFHFAFSEIKPDPRQQAEECFVQKLAEYFASGQLVFNGEERSLIQKYFPEFIEEYSKGTYSYRTILKHYGDFVALATQIKTIKPVTDFQEWTKQLIGQIFAFPAMSALKNTEKDHLLKAIFRLLELQDSKQSDLWRKEVEKFENWRIW